MIRRTAFWLILFAAITGEASADQLLFGLDDIGGGSGAPLSAPQGLRFALECFRLGESPEIVRLGSDVYWPDGSSGSHDFFTNDSPEARVFADRLTNGVDDELLSMTYDDHYGGGGTGGSESHWGFGDPDLAGNRIDLIRLVVHDLSIQPIYEPYGEGLQWNSNITWEFWGTPLPEPASAFLLLCGSMFFRRSPRPRRRSWHP